jgi:mannose-1-phosphate guanylyltransferase
MNIFSGLPRISIDFGILEKMSGLRLIPAEFIWDDIGNWAALQRALPHDEHGNIFKGPHTDLETDGCIVYSDGGHVAAFGVSSLVIVNVNGNVLVCPKERAADLKRLVKLLDRQSDPN